MTAAVAFEATMARMIAEVYDALKSAGADDDKARAAATAVAGQWEIDHRVADLGTRMDRLEGRMDRRRVAWIVWSSE